MKTQSKQSGVTLVELMIALVIGSVIMIGVGTVYSGSKRSYKVQEEFSRLQENGRFALNYIARFVREAGYSGCSAGLNALTNTLKNTDENPWNFNTGIEGYEATGTAPGETLTDSNALVKYPTGANGTASNWSIRDTDIATGTATTSNIYSDLIGGNTSDVGYKKGNYVVPHSDVLIARGVDGAGIELIDPNGSAQLNLEYTGTGDADCSDGSDSLSGICEGDKLIVSDCEKSVVFEVGNNPGTTGTCPNCTVNIQHPSAGSPGNDITSWGGNSGSYPELTFAGGDEVMKISTKTFYVGEGTNGPALFMKQANNDGQELVEGVENMQVLYGEDTDAPPDNIPDRYVPADKINFLGNIVAVRISLLLRSLNEIPHRDVPAAFPTFVMGGATAATGATIKAPKDKRMRRVMSMTIKLRNRAFSL